MTSASSISLSSTLRVLSQNINGFQTKITIRKRKQKCIVALGSLLRSLEVDFFAIQEPHFVTVEDRQAGMQCLSKYGYGLGGPLHEEGRGGVALAWKTSKWTLQSHFLSVYFFSCLFFFDLLCLCCSPGTMPRRDDVPQRSEADSNNPAAQKCNSDSHEQSVIMPQAKENGDAPAAATSALDTYEHAATTGKDSDTGAASYREHIELIDSINSLGLSADHTTAARPDETPWLDYYVQSIKAASEWRGYN